MRYLVLLLLLFCLEGKAQSYTFTLNECRVEATTGELRESFLVDRIRYFDRGDQTFIFDHESVLSVFDANITNYGRDSLKALIDIWIDSCNVVPIPTPPGPSALFANTTSFDANGIDEYVTVADADNLSFTDGAGTDEAFSISSWIYVETDQQGVVVAKDSTALQEYRLAYSTSANYDIYFLLYKSDGTAYIGREDDSGLALNQWNHITVTYSAATETSADIKIYRNGIRVDDADLTLGSYTGMTNTITPLTIGDKLVSLPLDGKIDQPTIFNKELSIEEVKEVMAVRDYSYLSASLQSSIVSSWYMDSPDDLGVANGVTDRFGSNDGTGVNTTTADNLVECITFPYDYQLDTSALYTNLTPFQDDSASAEMGFAWDFDGVSDYIDLGDKAVFSFGDGAGNDVPFSFELWFKKDDDVNGMLFAKTLLNNEEYRVYYPASVDAIDIILFDASGNYIGMRCTDDAIDLGKYYHVVCTYSATTKTTADLKVYINGVEDSATPLTSGVYAGMSNTTSSLNIGRREYVGSNLPWDGDISHTAIYDRVLTPTEITELYNGHGLIDVRDTDLSGNLIGYWNGYNSTNTASGVLDLSANSNNGTPTNMSDADIQYNFPKAIFESDSSASFDLTNVGAEYVNVASPSGLSFGNAVVDSPFSVSLWVQMTSFTATTYLFSKGSNSSNREYQLSLTTAGDMEFQIHDLSGTKYRGRAYNAATTGTWLNIWRHVVITYDGSATNAGVKIYMDAVRRDDIDRNSGTYTAMHNTGGSFKIGTSGFGNYGDKKMSNVSVYDRVLTLCEIQEIFNNKSPVDPRLTTVSANVISHWRLNSGDDSNGTVLDIVGSNNGTSINAPTLDETSYPTN